MLFRKYAGIEQNCATFVTNMLDFVKDTVMKLDAMAFKIPLWAPQGRKCHHLCEQILQFIIYLFFIFTCRL